MMAVDDYFLSVDLGYLDWREVAITALRLHLAAETLNLVASEFASQLPALQRTDVRCHLWGNSYLSNGSSITSTFPVYASIALRSWISSHRTT